jgi:TfoX C-terminal domain.
MESLTSLPNISKVISADLHKAGITTPEELKKIGSKEAFILIRMHADADACVSKLCALEGAIQGVRWHLLPDEVKAELKVFHKAL